MKQSFQVLPPLDLMHLAFKRLEGVENENHFFWYLFSFSVNGFLPSQISEVLQVSNELSISALRQSSVK